MKNIPIGYSRIQKLIYYTPSGISLLASQKNQSNGILDNLTVQGSVTLSNLSEAFSLNSLSERIRTKQTILGQRIKDPIA
jgi:hypothetical protein